MGDLRQSSFLSQPNFSTRGRRLEEQVGRPLLQRTTRKLLLTEDGQEFLRHAEQILQAQEFRSGIPAGLPDDARVANKTGEISTVAHDTGLVYLPDREPYAVTILTRWDADRTSGRRDTLARISRAVYEHLTGVGNAG